MEAKNTSIDNEKQDILKEYNKRKEVDERWRKRCVELQTEVDKLKKESSDFYSTERFAAGYSEFDWLYYESDGVKASEELLICLT